MLRNNRKSSSFTLYVFYREEGKEETRKSWSSIGKSFPLEIADRSMEAESVEASFYFSYFSFISLSIVVCH